MIDYENLQKLNAPFFNEYETAFKDVMQGGWYVLGKKVEEFEKAYSSYCNVKHTIGVANGLDALTLSLKAFKFEKGFGSISSFQYLHCNYSLYRSK
jgi:dTDP-4-amino-4,6-dideoxygalactose transaminase